MLAQQEFLPIQPSPLPLNIYLNRVDKDVGMSFFLKSMLVVW